MTLLIEDTARNNLAAWTADASQNSDVSGAVISPFTTPRAATGYKQSALQTVERLQDSGLTVWFDVETHALQMPAVGDFRYYNAWDLWSAQVGDLSDSAEISDHIGQVFERQDELGVPHLAPTILLHSAQSRESQRAVEIAELAFQIDTDAALGVAGDSAFWSGRAALDAHVGALAQLETGQWFLTVTRHTTVLPVPAMAEEVHGLCRTARALSDDADVHISHGDLAGLPAIAAGATSLGTGWDPRQRVVAYASYETRSAGDGGQWFQQATLEGLLSLLTRGEATVLYQQDQALAARLLPGAVPPGPGEAFLHHADVLSRVVAGLRGASAQAAYTDLSTRYGAAAADWPTVAQHIGVTSRATGWLGGVSAGLSLYAQTEGF